MFFKALTFSFLFGLISSAHAGYVAGVGWGTVKEITVQATDHRFTLEGASLCGTNVFTIHTSTDQGREQFATILAAALSGKKVFLQTWQGCPTDPVSNPAGNWGMLANNFAIVVQF